MSADRQTDELHLRWVRQRTSGASCGDIARTYGIKPERVRVVTNRILDADRAESGEPIAGQYWRAA